jgi:CHAT domain-containing protein/tetratricopeptide (TPR) repeat protein
VAKAEAEIAAGAFAAAGEIALEAASAARAAGNRRMESEALHLSGIARIYRGEYAGAREQFAAALAIDEEAGDLLRQATRRNNIANTHYFQGEYTTALREYQRAHETVLRAPADADREPLRLAISSSLAALLQRLGQHRTALDFYRQVEAQLDLLPAEQQTVVLGNLGVLYRNLGDPYAALARYRRALAIQQRTSDPIGETGVWTNIGIVHLTELRAPQEAESAFARAMQRATRSEFRREEAQLAYYLGECARQLGRYTEGRAWFEQAQRLSQELGLAEEGWKAKLGLGRLARNVGDDATAQGHLTAAVDQVDSLRARTQSVSLRQRFLSDKRAPFDELIALHLDNTRDGTARPADQEVFGLQERMRARALRDLLSVAAEGASAESHGVSLARMRALREQIAAARRAGGQPSAIPAMEQEYLRLEASVWGERLPALANTATLDSVRSRLGSDAILLSYWVSEDRAAVVWVSESDSGVSELPWGNNASVALNTLRGALQDPGSAWEPAARAVANHVFPKRLAAALRKVRRVWIVPDRELASIPFAVLPLDRPPGDNPEILYLPAAALRMRSRAATGESAWLPWQQSVDAFGAPAFGMGAEQAGVEALPPPLPGAQAEMEAIRRIVPGRMRVYAGDEAQKTAILDRASKAPVLHFATHAVVDEQDPGQSYILLAAKDAYSGEGQLTAREIPLLSLDGMQLITLSACDTARGRMLEGEGVQNLAGAFLAAGAGSVVSTLWAVEDGATAQWMAFFYEELASGKHPSLALRNAQVRLRERRSAWSHPYYWSAFVLQGEGTVPPRWPRPWSFWLAGVSAFFAILAALAWVRQSRKRGLHPRARRSIQSRL